MPQCRFELLTCFPAEIHLRHATIYSTQECLSKIRQARARRRNRCAKKTLGKSRDSAMRCPCYPLGSSMADFEIRVLNLGSYRSLITDHRLLKIIITRFAVFFEWLLVTS